MWTKVRGILGEALAVAVVGLGCALLANFLSPRGLSLTRDYFPKAPASVAVGAGSATNATTPALAATNGPGPGGTHGAANGGAESTATRLLQKGLQPIAAKEVLPLFQDPLHAQDLIVFVDARDDTHYEAGHIPGAFQFDRYYPDKYLPAVLPACANAVKIVVYCTGGACEDSEFAALTLKEAGMPADKIFVFIGGITEWTAQGWPVESGVRNSGAVKGRAP